jgi:hypothetical protein
MTQKVDDALGQTLTQESRAAAQGSTTAPATSNVAGAARYERGRELGRGGMGRVVEAVDKQFNRVVAVKELTADGDERRRRFATEALVTGNLEHPGIPSVYERGTDERGVPFYAMRKVRGRTLAAHLGDARTLADRLALLPAVVKTAQALGYAHEHGVIHRDVKPDNIIVGPYGDVVLLDWGIARVRGLGAETPTTESGSGTGGAASSTVYGSIVGTPAYMAPEQAAGMTDDIDERTDVFALGALLYHVLTGRAPYHGTKVDEVLALAREGHRRDVAELEPAAPAALAAICARAMAKQPADRFRNATELAQALEHFESNAFLAKPASRLISAVVNVVIVVAVILAIVSSIALITIVPAFKVLGAGAWGTIVLAVIGAILSILEWLTRGRYVLSPIAMGFALATLCSGVVGFATGYTKVFDGLRNATADQLRFNHIVAEGSWEVMGNITLGLSLAAAQFLLWGIARRRAKLAEIEGAATGAGTTTTRTIRR